ncbi:cytochrome c biogenesis protein CcsA [Halobellus limi]|uniref:Heme exporter protein C n=2 Tax=Halobellus limi TaxID=699433 RepID=A0A1H5WI00_9EURY|nr:cytochrome c biogenesis protein CcsA [Halobellus limi]SEF98487.1 heme exporter protein C [Halobellus limi]
MNGSSSTQDDDAHDRTSRDRSVRFARFLGTVTGVLHRVTGSRFVAWGAFGFGLLSMVLVFGFASDTMYGIEHGANLLAYWHISLAWVAAAALGSTFVGSALYLRYRGPFWSRLAHSSGELGFLFATLTLLLGSAWGRVIWNSWWEWTDVRLVTFLIVWFIYAGYLVVHSATDAQSGDRYAAVYGVVGFVTVPLSYASTRLWTPTFHETTIGNSGVSANIDPLTLVVTLVAATFLYLYLVGIRIRIHELEQDVRRARLSRRR